MQLTDDLKIVLQPYKEVYIHLVSVQVKSIWWS